jgi:hypothetical protein
VKYAPEFSAAIHPLNVFGEFITAPAMAGAIGITIGLRLGREIHDKRTPGTFSPCAT